jgi:MFS-type transporter involved in bile tolerance (Atg22 family)
MLGFVLVSDLSGLWIAALFFGVAMSVSEGVERAVIGDLAGESARGTLFGWYYALVGVASIPAGLILGGIWQMFGAPYAYGFAAIAGLIATAVLILQVAKRRAIAS